MSTSEATPLPEIDALSPGGDEPSIFDIIDQKFGGAEEAAPETAAPGVEEAKPADPTPETTKTPATKTADELIAEAEEGVTKGKMPRAAHWDAVKQKKAEAEAEAESLRKELEALKQAKPAEDPEKQVLKTQLEELKKQYDEYDLEIKAVRVESSREFREQVTYPGQAVIGELTSLAERNGIDKSLVVQAVAQTSDPKARSAALSELAASLNDYDKTQLYSLSHRFSDLAKLREQYLSNAGTVAQELEQRRVQEMAEQKAQTLTTWKAETNRAWGALEAKLPELKALQVSPTMASEIASRDPDTVPPLEKAYSLAAGKLLPSFVAELRKAQAKVTELESSLQKYQKATPSAGGGSPALATPEEDDGIDFAELMSRRAANRV